MATTRRHTERRLRRRRERKASESLQGVTGTVQAGEFHTPAAAKTSANPPDHSPKVQYSGGRLSDTGNAFNGAAATLKAIRARGLRLHT